MLLRELLYLFMELVGVKWFTRCARHLFFWLFSGSIENWGLYLGSLSYRQALLQSCSRSYTFLRMSFFDLWLRLYHWLSDHWLAHSRWRFTRVYFIVWVTHLRCFAFLLISHVVEGLVEFFDDGHFLVIENDLVVIDDFQNCFGS